MQNKKNISILLLLSLVLIVTLFVIENFYGESLQGKIFKKKEVKSSNVAHQEDQSFYNSSDQYSTRMRLNFKATPIFGPTYYENESIYQSKGRIRDAVDTLVIVNKDDYPLANNSDILKIFTISQNTWLLPKSGFHFNVMDIKYVSLGEGDISTVNSYKYFTNYFGKEANTAPEYIVLFAGDSTSKKYGGYADTFNLVINYDEYSDYCNEFKPKYELNVIIPRGVIDYNHKYGLCGYDKLKENIISDVSLNGQCHNTDGIKCVIKNGNQICDYAVNSFYTQNSYNFIADTVSHELLHHYGNNGAEDHFGSTICIDSMGGEQKFEQYLELNSVGAFKEPDGLHDEWNKMCPSVWEIFKHSQQNCPTL